MACTYRCANCLYAYASMYVCKDAYMCVRMYDLPSESTLLEIFCLRYEHLAGTFYCIYLFAKDLDRKF